MLTIRDIMTPDPFTLDFEASAGEAAWALTRRHIGGAPVIDGEGNVVGMISKSDLVDPEPAEWLDGEGTVGDRMAPRLFALYADDPALAAARMMAQRAVHRVIVLDGDSRVVGIVTTMDVVRALARGCEFDPRTDREPAPAPAPRAESTARS
jgi:CBS domain-containing protein